jgi:hypothetical protein
LDLYYLLHINVQYQNTGQCVTDKAYQKFLFRCCLFLGLEGPLIHAQKMHYEKYKTWTVSVHVMYW